MNVYKSNEGRAAVRGRYRELLSGWPVQKECRYIGETHVIDSGAPEAEPLLLLHGTMSNSAAWMGDVERWSSEFRVMAADLPGEPGLSSELRVSPAGDGFESWLEKLLDGLGYKDTAVSIVGQSLGAFAALKFAVKHPERIKKVSILTTAGVAPQKLSFMFKALPLMMMGKWGHDKIEKMVTYGVETGEEAADFGRLVSKHCRPLTEPIPLFSDAQLSRLTMPVQFFGGDRDVMLDTEATAGRLERLLPNVECRILSGVGHTVILQTDSILDFMLRN